MACFATPYGLRCAGHCSTRAHAQQSCRALIAAGGNQGVTSAPLLYIEKMFAAILERQVEHIGRYRTFAASQFDARAPLSGV